MAFALVSVTGTVVGPSGAGVGGGKITARLSPPGGYANDGAANQVVARELEISISAAGAVAFSIIPNDAITPAGSVYQATYELADGTTWTKEWDIASAPASQDIGDL